MFLTTFCTDFEPSFRYWVGKNNLIIQGLSSDTAIFRWAARSVCMFVPNEKFSALAYKPAGKHACTQCTNLPTLCHGINVSMSLYGTQTGMYLVCSKYYYICMNKLQVISRSLQASWRFSAMTSAFFKCSLYSLYCFWREPAARSTFLLHSSLVDSFSPLIKLQPSVFSHHQVSQFNFAASSSIYKAEMTILLHYHINHYLYLWIYSRITGCKIIPDCSFW